MAFSCALVNLAGAAGAGAGSGTTDRVVHVSTRAVVANWPPVGTPAC